jgi:radical SAM superfamily enzyme YgiQ (UPF0313 family)
LIIYPDIIELKQWKKTFHYGLGSLSAYLKSKGVEVELIYLSHFPEEKELEKKINKFQPDLIGFSSTSAQFQYIEPLANIVKPNFPEIPIICGGIHAILCPEQFLKIKNIDIICIGEGELTTNALLNKIKNNEDYSTLSGIWVKKNEHIFKNPQREIVRDLDIIPFCDRDLFDFAEMHEPKNYHIASYLASRGCPYNCSYCANKKLREQMGLKPSDMRIHSVDYVINELCYIRDNFNIKYFRFEDDILPLNMKWFTDFSNKYKEKVRLPFSCNLRFNLVNDEVLILLKNAGCDQIQIGLENGSDEYRRKYLNRFMSQDMIIGKMHLIEKMGFKIYTFNMLGGPNEKPQHLLETIKLNAVGNSHMVQLSLVNPYPGTQLYDFCKKYKLIEKDAFKRQSYFEDKPTIKNPYLPFDQLLFYKNNFFKLMKFYSVLYQRNNWFSKKIMKLADLLFAQHFIVKIFPALQNTIFIYRNLRNLLKGKPLVKKIPRSYEGVGVN